MKKLFAFISVLAVAMAGLFADVTAKKNADGKIEATFFYGNPRATEVLLAGDFTNWQNGALPMEKTDKGFTLTKVFDAGTTVKYKFIADGNWTTDLKAPDFVDDGFGGKNSVAELDSLAGGADAANPKASLKFLTWSMFGAQAKFLTDDDSVNELDAGLESAGLNLKSYVKFSGYALPKVPVYVEVAVAEQDTFENLYKQDELEWEDGLKNLIDLPFDPLYYLGGQDAAKTYLGHFKFGIESNYVNWTTGYKYAKLPPHNINDWTTVDKEWEAGYSEIGGYNYFELGSALQQLGPISLKAAIAPNRSADRKGGQYGFFGWFDLSTGPAFTLSFQYNSALGKTFDTIFGHCYEQDFIAGYKGIFGPVTLRANYLANIYGDGDLSRIDGVTYYSKFIPATSDVGEVTSSAENPMGNMAGTMDVTYSNDVLYARVGGRFRGYQAGQMYVEEGADDHTNISDQLGDLNHLRAWVDVNANIAEGVNIGLNPYVQMVFDKDATEYKASDKTYENSPFKNKDTLKLYAKPYFALDFNDLAYVDAKLDGYAEFAYYTEDEDKVSSAFGTENYTFEAIGLRYEQNLGSDFLKAYTLQYCFDNTDTDYLFNTLIFTGDLAKDYHLQAGLGLRTLNPDSKKDDPNNPFAFFIGAYKQIPVLAKPTAYLQFMYAMDPYQKFGDGPTAFKFDDYKLDDGVTDYMNNYAVRIGLQWDL